MRGPVAQSSHQAFSAAALASTSAPGSPRCWAAAVRMAMMAAKCLTTNTTCASSIFRVPGATIPWLANGPSLPNLRSSRDPDDPDDTELSLSLVRDFFVKLRSPSVLLPHSFAIRRKASSLKTSLASNTTWSPTIVGAAERIGLP